MFADLELAAPWAARGEAEHATPTQAARFLPSEPGVWPVKTCSSLPLRLSSCTRLPTNSATTIAPFPMIAQASGASKGTAVRNTRRKAPSCAPETRRVDTMWCGLVRAAACLRHASPPSRECVRGAEQRARAPVYSSKLRHGHREDDETVVVRVCHARTRHAITQRRGRLRGWAQV